MPQLFLSHPQFSLVFLSDLLSTIVSFLPTRAATYTYTALCTPFRLLPLPFSSVTQWHKFRPPPPPPPSTNLSRSLARSHSLETIVKQPTKTLGKHQIPPFKWGAECKNPTAAESYGTRQISCVWNSRRKKSAKCPNCRLIAILHNPRVILNCLWCKIRGQGNGRKFLDRFKSYFGSQISLQSLNEVHIYRLQPKSATQGEFYSLSIFLSLIVTAAGELCKLTRVTGPEFPHPFSPVGRCLPATGRCRAVRYKRQCLPGFCRGAGIAQWLEHRTRDWKVAGSNPCWNGGRIFFSRVDFLCWLLFRYPFHPRVTTVARKKSRSFCQKVQVAGYS